MKKAIVYSLYGVGVLSLILMLVFFFNGIASYGDDEKARFFVSAVISLISSFFIFGIAICAEAAMIYIEKNKPQKKQ